MKVVVYGPDRRVGIWQGDRILDLNRAALAFLGRSSGSGVAEAHRLASSDLLRFIESGAEGLELARAVIDFAEGKEDPEFVTPGVSVKLWAPWAGRRIACAGANYALHVSNFLSNQGEQALADEHPQVEKSDPQGFWKVPFEVMGPEDEVIKPSRSNRFDYEAELAIVIGRRGKDIAAADAQQFIWGVTLGNDWSDRTVFGKTGGRLSLNLMKNFDCAVSLGPCILVTEHDIQDFDISLSVNGEERQRYNTREMIHTFSEFIAYISRDLTLVAGDVIMGGTGAGTAMDMSRPVNGERFGADLFLQPGDFVEISCPLIGTLRNIIVEKPADERAESSASLAQSGDNASTLSGGRMS